jgi:hypothetical protein
MSDEPHTHSLAEMISGIPATQGFNPREGYTMACMFISRGGQILGAAITPYAERGVESGMLRDTILDARRGQVPPQDNTEVGLLLICYGAEMEKGFGLIDSAAMQVPEIPVADKVWSNGREWARWGDPNTIDSLPESSHELTLLDDEHHPPILRATNAEEELAVEVDFDDPGSLVTPLMELAVRAGIQRVEAQPTQEEKDAYVAGFFAHCQEQLQFPEHQDESVGMLMTFGGVYLSYSMKTLAMILKDLSKTIVNETMPMLWSYVANYGPQEWSRPLYTIAASAWEEAGQPSIARFCRTRGLNEAELAELASMWAEVD